MESLKEVYAPRIQYTFCVACPCSTDDRHYINLDKVLTGTSRIVQCCRGKFIAKEPIKEKFCHRSQKLRKQNVRGIIQAPS